MKLLRSRLSALNSLYRFLPVQLLLLHFRKFQLLLIFWVVVCTTITGHFAKSFGAASLFLAPEYRGRIDFLSMLLLGSAMAVFVMAWHITTFIIHSKRIPFIGATRQAFLKYCINNSGLPLLFLIFYSVRAVSWQHFHEGASIAAVISRQLGFYLGFLLLIVLSFVYFFRVGRDLLKTVLGGIANPSPIREIIPYDSLDVEFDMVRADTYLTETLQVEHIKNLERYHLRLLHTVLRRHHRNATTATIFSLVLLLVLGIFMDQPLLRIPAGAGFLILFAVMMGLVGAVKYFLKSWEMIGYMLFALLLGWMVRHNLFDLRSIAYGLDYKTETQPAYDYEALKRTFTPQRYAQDYNNGLHTLESWQSRRGDSAAAPLIIISISGGGSRAAFWTFRALQYIDSTTGGALYRNTALITGASGGMLGAAYWRSLHIAADSGRITDVYAAKYREAIGGDLLNAIVFSLASVDLINPFNKIAIAGYTYPKDRGYAMEQELIRNTGGMLDRKIGDFTALEQSGTTPSLIVSSTIVNDGRRLMISAQPVSYLCRPVYSLDTALYSPDLNPPIDAVDFLTFFARQNPYNLRLTTALRMNATFPFILPVVKMPSKPVMNIMDAGLRDNFGSEVASRYLYVFREWLRSRKGEVLWLDIRDSREWNVMPSTAQDNLGGMLTDPLTVIQHKWQPFQSYAQTYLKDMARQAIGPKLRFATLQYIPAEQSEPAALNFHLTQREKADLYNSIYHSYNAGALKVVLGMLGEDSVAHP